jgi:hypothetical protein
MGENINIYPHMDEVDSERLRHIIDKAKKETGVQKKSWLEQLHKCITSTIDSQMVPDLTNTSWLLWRSKKVVGKSGALDLQVMLSQAFSNFEPTLRSHADQNAAEGFLHLAHLSYFKRYQEHFAAGDGESVLTFNGQPLQPGKEYISLDHFCRRSAILTQYFLAGRESDPDREILNLY